MTTNASTAGQLLKMWRQRRRSSTCRPRRGAQGLPGTDRGTPPLAAARPPHAGLAVPLELALPDGRVLSMLSTTTVFGTPLDITLEELAIESFFPADAATQEALQQLDDT